MGVKDAEKLVKFIATFTNPTSFVYYVGKNLILNGVEIFHNIMGAVKAYKEGEY
jgi:hypothetical protein